MFGHQNDVISQDQRADASVPLPEETIDALTTAPPTTSSTDNHDPVTSAPATDPQPASDSTSTMASPTVVTPTQPTQSLDGFIPTSQSQPAPATSFPSYSPAPMATVSPSAPYNTPQDDNPPISTFPPQEVVEPPVDTSPEPDNEPADTTSRNQQPEPTLAQQVKLSPDPDELLKIKQQALNSLSPLVNTLDVGPEEKFRTVMMLIQAADDHALLSDAYELAQSIPNEKARAQALLDVVNEINYFTSKSK